MTSTLSNPLINYQNSGIYTISLIAFDSSICPQSDTVQYPITVKKDSNYTLHNLACFNQQTQIGIPEDSFPNTSYLWSPGLGLSDSTIHNPNIQITQNETFQLIVNHICQDTVTVHVSVSQITAETDSLIITCSDIPLFLLQGNTNGTGNHFIWSSNTHFSDTLNPSVYDSSLTIYPNPSVQHFFFKVVNADGCIATDSVLIVVSDQTIQLSSDTFICQTDTISLRASNLFPLNAMDYYWSPTAFILGKPDSAYIQVTPRKTTTYSITAINDSGCVFTDSITVNVSTLNDSILHISALSDSVLLGFGTELMISPDLGYVYDWSPKETVENPNESTTLVYPNQTTTYTSQVTDPNNSNCSYKKEITVYAYEINCGEPDIFIPNAFSPNGDGQNDAFKITGDVIETMELEIYNRWGELVFETDQPIMGWDGTFNGTRVEPNVYVYQINITCIDQRRFSKKGNITVIR
jgi:gliding motility-associated-like protein